MYDCIENCNEKKGKKSRRQVETNGLGLDSNRHNLTVTQYDMRPSKKEEEDDGAQEKETPVLTSERLDRRRVSL